MSSASPLGRARYFRGPLATGMERSQAPTPCLVNKPLGVAASVDLLAGRRWRDRQVQATLTHVNSHIGRQTEAVALPGDEALAGPPV